MDTHECIRTRRSIRKFLEDPVKETSVQRILEAVRWAPSWANTQPWEVILVDDPDLRTAIRECVPESNPGRDAVVAAPMLIALCGRRGKSGFYKGTSVTVYGEWAMFDMGIAGEHICLAAHAEGLGTVHIGMLDHKRGGEILNLPDDVDLYDLIPVGAPAKEGKAPERRTIEEFTHRNRFSE